MTPDAQLLGCNDTAAGLHPSSVTTDWTAMMMLLFTNNNASIVPAASNDDLDLLLATDPTFRAYMDFSNLTSPLGSIHSDSTDIFAEFLNDEPIWDAMGGAPFIPAGSLVAGVGGDESFLSPGREVEDGWSVDAFKEFDVLSSVLGSSNPFTATTAPNSPYPDNLTIITTPPNSPSSPDYPLTPSPSPSPTPLTTHEDHPCPHPNCTLTFTTREKLKSHKRIHRRKREFPCRHGGGCEKVLYRRQDRERHEATHLE
ncbi:hypothetical protein HDU67_001232, partial [Dinochytrium kinnereticum]